MSIKRCQIRFTTFKILIFSFLILFLFSCEQNSNSKFRFVFMTDIHLEPIEKAVTGFDYAIEHTNFLKPEFVITGGDLIADALAQSFERSDSLYKLYNQTIKK